MKYAGWIIAAIVAIGAIVAYAFGQKKIGARQMARAKVAMLSPGVESLRDEVASALEQDEAKADALKVRLEARRQHLEALYVQADLPAAVVAEKMRKLDL